MGIKSPFLSEIVNDTHDHDLNDHVLRNRKNGSQLGSRFSFLCHRRALRGRLS